MSRTVAGRPADLRGAVAIVTGGASGIGRALCAALAARGATVTVADVAGDAALGAVEAIQRAGGNARAATVDVAGGEPALAELVSEAVAAGGRLDLMCNNAGVSITGEVRDITHEQWQRVVDVDLWGVIHGTRAAYTQMLRQGSGHIVNVASILGLIASPLNAPVVAAKHAVVGFSRALRAEAAPLGVRVSVVCPGYVRTALYDTLTVVGARAEDLAAARRMPMLAPEAAARHILRGMARNREVIVFPALYRLLWRVYRLAPWALAPASRVMVSRFRQLRAPE